MDQFPVDGEATLALARSARRFLVKTGDRVDEVAQPVTDADALRLLVHADGFLRVPVLVLGDVLVRGYTEELYRRALASAAR